MKSIFSRYFLILLLGCFGVSLPAQTQSSPQFSKPNIIIIMADDLGFSDPGCYGGEIRTPNLDRLARNGMRFTQFYNTARCCPSRAAMLTGLYPHQAGIGRMTMDAGLPGYRGYLTENTVTIAELLKQAGYQTGMTGKWHVSETRELEKDKQLKWLAHQADYGDFSNPATYPTGRGFDKYFGNIWGVVDYFDPFSLVNGQEPVKNVPPNYYYTDAIGDTAVAYVDQFVKKGQPFFLYVAHCAPHWPLQALPEDIARYENQYKGGWEAIRQSRYQKMLGMNLIDRKTTPLSPRMFPEKDWGQNPHQAWDARAMAVHAAMVDRMDQNIGKLITKLEQTGQLNNTVIFFLSDNGASYERPEEYGPGFDRAGSTRDGRTVAFPVDKSMNALPGTQTAHTGIGAQWANVANTPFRYYKSKLHEGGITTPFIVHWPAGMAAKGKVSGQPGHVIDLMATCLQLAGTSYPGRFNGRPLTPMAGKSLVPVFKGNERKGHEILFWEHFGAKAIRQGNWKLVKLDWKSDWELYDLTADRTELNNLAGKYPEKVSQLAELWEDKAKEFQVVPAP